MVSSVVAINAPSPLSAKVSRDSAPQRQEAGPVVDLRGELHGYTVSFTSVLEDIDATPLMKGLPDDRCPCPHGALSSRAR
jgi:hypothetical protein